MIRCGHRPVLREVGVCTREITEDPCLPPLSRPSSSSTYPPPLPTPLFVVLPLLRPVADLRRGCVSAAGRTRRDDIVGSHSVLALVLATVHCCTRPAQLLILSASARVINIYTTNPTYCGPDVVRVLPCSDLSSCSVTATAPACCGRHWR